MALVLLPAAAAAALPSVSVNAVTSPLANFGAHRGVTVSGRCAAGARLVGGGGYLRTAADPSIAPTNGLVLGATAMSTGAAPVDVAASDGVADPATWLSLANFTGVSEAGDQASAFALCATTGGPSHTVVKVARTTGANAAQEAQAPTLTTATCPAGTRLIGGGAATSTPDQVNDGVTAGNNGNLKPLGDYPSSATGVPAAGGATTATSWSAYGSAGLPSAGDAVTALALCSSDPATPPVQVARVDVAGPDAQAGTTVTTASASCPAGTRMLGGGYSADETVTGVGSGLQPQQGYHMRGSYPSTNAGLPPVAVANATANPGTWTALLQAGGQNLAAGRHMTTRAFAMCATAAAIAPLRFSSTPPSPARYGAAYLVATSGGSGDPVTFSIASASASVCTIAAGSSTVRFTGVGTCTINATQAASGQAATQAVTVTPAPLTVTGPKLSKAYGEAVPALPPSYSGLVNGDGAPSPPATCTTTAVALSPVGTYPITCAGATDHNYQPKYVAGSLKITKAATSLQALALSSTQNHPSAVLRRADNAAAIAGQTVTFRSGATTVCSAVTDAAGLARCTALLGAPSFTATYAGSANYLGSSA